MGRVARLQGSAAVTSGTMLSGSFYTTSPQEWPACAVLGAFVCLGIVARRAVCGVSRGLSGRKKSADRSRRRFSQNNCDIPPLFRGRPAANPPKIGPFPHLPPPVPPFPAFLRYVVPVHFQYHSKCCRNNILFGRRRKPHLFPFRRAVSLDNG